MLALPQSPEFVKWGDRVLRCIKSQLTRNLEVAPEWMYLSTARSFSGSRSTTHHSMAAPVITAPRTVF